MLRCCQSDYCLKLSFFPWLFPSYFYLDWFKVTCFFSAVFPQDNWCPYSFISILFCSVKLIPQFRYFTTVHFIEIPQIILLRQTFSFVDNGFAQLFLQKALCSIYKIQRDPFIFHQSHKSYLFSQTLSPQFITKINFLSHFYGTPFNFFILFDVKLPVFC